jgi:hypothetical protein
MADATSSKSTRMRTDEEDEEDEDEDNNDGVAACQSGTVQLYCVAYPFKMRWYELFSTSLLMFVLVL